MPTTDPTILAAIAKVQSDLAAAQTDLAALAADIPAPAAPAVNVAPVITLTGNSISWAAQPAATSFKGAISNGPATMTGRVTTYAVPTGTSWAPPAVAAGGTYYYGVAAVGSAPDAWSDEVSITWPVPAPVSKIHVSINNCGGWGAGTCADFKNIGVPWTRQDINRGTDLAGFNNAITAGLNVLPMYTGGSDGDGNGVGLTVANVQSDMTNVVVPLLKAHGITVLEFLNESYYGMAATTYAPLYHAAHVICSANGIQLLCVAAPDTFAGRATWLADLKANLPGGAAEVDAFTLHPYPPDPGDSTSLTTVDSQGMGWPTVLSLHTQAAALGFTNQKWWLTEFGVKKTATGSDGTGQATVVTATLNNLLTPAYAHVAMLNFYMAKDTDNVWGFENSAGTKLKGFLALQTWLAANGGSVG